MATLTATGIQFSITDTINSKYWMYPSGSKKLFYQANAPTGWTRDAVHDNKALRVVSSAGGGSGGSITFTASFPASAVPISVPISATPQVTNPGGVASFLTGQTTLAISQLPDHTHSSLQSASGGAGANPFSNAGTFRVAGTTATSGFLENGGVGGGAHDHPFSGTASVTTSGATSMDLSVQYVDAIICTFT